MEKAKVSFKKTGTAFLTKVLLPGLVITALTGLSFFFYGPFSSLAYSNRLFLIGVVFMVIGTVVVFAQMITGRGSDIFFGGNKDRLGKAKRFLNGSLEEREIKEKRYNVGGVLWLIGIMCILASIAVTLVVS
jgi:hypothetical protein